jgi:signal transduction histidine kinase
MTQDGHTLPVARRRRLSLPDRLLEQLQDGRLMFAFAHDVRSYLRTVVTRIQLVQRGGGSALPEAERHLLEDAVTAAGEVNGLLSSLLTLMNPEADQGEISLRLAIQGSLIELKSALAAADAKVDIRNDLNLQVPNGLKRVFKELIANACTFRESSRPLRISLETKITADSRLAVTVSDNGLGVPAEYADQIFAPFRRMHSRDDFPGYGLGLSICRRIIEDFGGTIAAVSKTEGLSVTFVVPAGE